MKRNLLVLLILLMGATGRATPWNNIFNAHWNLANPDDINFAADPPVITTNVQERAQ